MEDLVCQGYGYFRTFENPLSDVGSILQLFPGEVSRVPESTPCMYSHQTYTDKFSSIKSHSILDFHPSEFWLKVGTIGPNSDLKVGIFEFWQTYSTQDGIKFYGRMLHYAMHIIMITHLTLSYNSWVIPTNVCFLHANIYHLPKFLTISSLS